MKKWNWSLFFIIVSMSFIGVMVNDSISDTKEGALVALSFGIPIGLLWAWVTKDAE